MSNITTVDAVRKWWATQHGTPWTAVTGASAADAHAAITVLMRELDKRRRKLSKTVHMSVPAEQFATIANSRSTVTLRLEDPHARYEAGMLAVVMEFDSQTKRLTQRQVLRLVAHVWQAPIGYADDIVIVALRSVEEA